MIGAPGKSSNGAGPDAGGVYVFRRSASGWACEAQFAPPDIQAGDQFGLDVSLSGHTVAVGAPRHGTQGAVFLYDTPAIGEWTETTRLDPHGAAGTSDFGTSVSLDFGRLLVGAPSNGLPSPSAGRAMLYDRHHNGSWSLARTFVPADAFPGDRVGMSVLAQCATSLVGAPFQPDF